MRIDLKRIKWVAAALVALVVAAIVYQYVRSWWSTRPTEERLVRAVKESLDQKRAELRPCIALPSLQYPDETLTDSSDANRRAWLVWTFDDVAPEAFAELPRPDGRQPAKYEIDSFPRYLQNERPKSLEKLAALEKAGLLRGTKSHFLRNGTPYNATLYEVTLAGRLNGPVHRRENCFIAGTMGDPRIVDSRRVADAGAGLEGYAVRFSVATTARRPWTEVPEVKQAFPEIEKQLAPTEGMAMLVRGTSGWIEARILQERTQHAHSIVEAQRSIEKRMSEMKLGTSIDQWATYGQLAYLRIVGLRQDAAVAPISASGIAALIREFGDKFNWNYACLRWPGGNEGDRVRRPTSQGSDREALVLEIPGRPDREQWRIERLRRNLEAFVRTGIAEREETEGLVYAGGFPKEAQGMAFRGAIYRPTAKMLPSTLEKRRDCISLGALEYDIKGLETVGRFEIVFHGVARVTKPTEIAKELRAELPEVDAALKEGLYFSGTVSPSETLTGHRLGGIDVRAPSSFDINPGLALRYAQLRATPAYAAAVPVAAAAVASTVKPAQPTPPARKPSEWGAQTKPPTVVWNPNNREGRLSNEGLSFEYRGAGVASRIVATKGYASGKWYFELQLKVAEGAKQPSRWTNAGVATLSSDGRSPVARSDDPASNILESAGHSVMKDGSIIGIAVDLERRRMWYRLDGEWINGNPEHGSGGVPLARRETYYAYVAASAPKEIPDRWTANFGHRVFAHPLPKGFRPYDS